MKTALAALVAAALGFVVGFYLSGGSFPLTESGVRPAPGSVRVLYSLDEKRNDQALISLIDNAREHAYFAIYEFTLTDVADALVRAKKRGVEVRGIVDRESSTSSYESPIISKLMQAGIPLETQQHASGIMHIKALVTENAYASGSYNWTHSATTENDEVLEIGTDPNLRARYDAILKRLFEMNAGRAESSRNTAVTRTYDYTEARAHIGETAAVLGTVVDVYTSRSGTTFLDYCRDYDKCPFTAVIFARDKGRFSNLSRYDGTTLTVSGRIGAYQNRAEIILHDPAQISVQ